MPNCLSEGVENCKIQFNIQGWAKEWALGCVNPATWLSLAAGGEFTQPRAHSFAQPCTLSSLYGGQTRRRHRGHHGHDPHVGRDHRPGVAAGSQAVGAAEGAGRSQSGHPDPH